MPSGSSGFHIRCRRPCGCLVLQPRRNSASAAFQRPLSEWLIRPHCQISRCGMLGVLPLGCHRHHASSQPASPIGALFHPYRCWRWCEGALGRIENGRLRRSFSMRGWFTQSGNKRFMSRIVRGTAQSSSLPPANPWWREYMNRERRTAKHSANDTPSLSCIRDCTMTGSLSPWPKHTGKLACGRKRPVVCAGAQHGCAGS